MFESAEIGHRVGKQAYREAVPALRAALLDAQVDVHARGSFPVLVLIGGLDGAGKGETLNGLYQWMDPRFLSTLAFAEPSGEEAEHPAMWRYWRALPPKGRIGLFAGSWYSEPIRLSLSGELPVAALDGEADRINRFEAMLVNEGALVLKFWFHLSKEAQKKRLKALAADPHTAWRVTPVQWQRLKEHPQLMAVAGHLLRITSTPWAPWTVVDGSDDRYRALHVGQVLLGALQQRLAAPVLAAPAHAPPAVPARVATDGRNVLSALDLKAHLAEPDYAHALAHWQGRLAELMRHPRMRRRAVVCAFEGADAAGKGGSIRRICAALDARQYQVVPVSAPTDEERAQPYLWRFWRHLPRRGQLTVFDRTWYGRVLVERVEGFCAEADWLRAYAEINDFEHELAESGTIVVKFWLQISQEEQLRRFREREQTAFKRFKITAEDWRNRDKWAAYQQAVCDMVDRTSTGHAPWTLVEANDKNHARVKVLRTLCERLAVELAVKAAKGGPPAEAVRQAKPGKTRQRGDADRPVAPADAATSAAASAAAAAG